MGNLPKWAWLTLFVDDHAHDDFLKMYSWVYQGLKVLMALHVELQMILVFLVVEVAGEALGLQMVHGVEMVQEEWTVLSLQQLHHALSWNFCDKKAKFRKYCKFMLCSQLPKIFFYKIFMNQFNII